MDDQEIAGEFIKARLNELANCELLSRDRIREIIRNRLEEISEYCYGDGAVLFNTNICTPAEAERLCSSGILDTIARVLAESLSQ